MAFWKTRWILLVNRTTPMNPSMFNQAHRSKGRVLEHLAATAPGSAGLGVLLALAGLLTLAAADPNALAVPPGAVRVWKSPSW